ncbi:N-acetylmuramoyl-L-alanine amidase family protein [Flavitalea antarctica]
MIRTTFQRALFIALMPLMLITSFHLSAQKQTIKTIIVDAGHGGAAVGAKGLFSNEADIALAIALKLGKRIEEEMEGIKVVYTRTTKDLPGGVTSSRVANRLRAEMANEARGDLFISIHCNSTRQKAGGWYAKRVIGYKNKVVYTGKGSKRKKKTVKVPITESYYVKNTRHGTETYIWAADRSGVKSEYINTEDDGEFAGDSTNAATTAGMPDMNTPEARIRAQLYEKRYFSKSLLLGTYIEEEFEKGGRLSQGVKQRNEEQIWVLQATGMPSVLVETGFISNKEEEEYLNSEKGQDEVVESIINALKRYRNGNASQASATN